jgi:hypothetical protein
VEAKGAGSSKATTKRYGQLFTGNQVGSHIGVAAVRALRRVSSGIDYPTLVFPDNRHHRDRVNAISPALAQLRIGIFWVSDNHEVKLQAPWDLET